MHLDTFVKKVLKIPPISCSPLSASEWDGLGKTGQVECDCLKTKLDQPGFIFGFHLIEQEAGIEKAILIGASNYNRKQCGHYELIPGQAASNPCGKWCF